MSLFKNRTVVGVICILLSLVICFGVTPLFNKSVSQKEQIIRVTQPILAGEEITADMVQAVEVGGYNLPENVIRLKENVVGKFATADLAAGDYIQPHHNRGSLKNRADEIAMELQRILAQKASAGICGRESKESLAYRWLELAASCAKVPIRYEADQIKQRQKEEQAQRGAGPVME